MSSTVSSPTAKSSSSSAVQRLAQIRKAQKANQAKFGALPPPKPKAPRKRKTDKRVAVRKDALLGKKALENQLHIKNGKTSHSSNVNEVLDRLNSVKAPPTMDIEFDFSSNSDKKKNTRRTAKKKQQELLAQATVVPVGGYEEGEIGDDEEPKAPSSATNSDEPIASFFSNEAMEMAEKNLDVEEDDDDDDDEALPDEFGDMLEKMLLEETQAKDKANNKRKREPAAKKDEAAAEEKPKRQRKKRARMAVPEPVPCPVNVQTAHDAQELLVHMTDRLAARELQITQQEAITQVLQQDKETMRELHAPLLAYMKFTDQAASESKVHEAYARIMNSFDQHIRSVKILQRAQNSCAIEIKRLCLTLESLMYTSIASHDLRRMPAGRRELVRPVYVPTERSDVVRRVEPPPMPAAVDAEHALDANGTVRVVRADQQPREKKQSFVPSQRMGIINESMARLHWDPRDTSTAHRITRARNAATALREQKALRQLGDVMGHEVLSPLSTTVPQLARCSTHI